MNRPNHRSKLRRVTVLRSLGSLAIAGPLVAFALRAAARAGDAIEPAVCTLTPAETEGPFFVDRQLERSDLRIDPSDGSRKPGVPLRLAIVVTRTTPQGCTPLAGASVDLWHADAFGTYSGVEPAKGSHFLRGYQRTDDAGRVTFTTIVPGWYSGRTAHIHFKIRTAFDRSNHSEFTSQLYFYDELLDTVYRRAPYTARGPRPVRNDSDGIFTAPLATRPQQENVAALLLALRPDADGYTGRFDVALGLSKPVAQDGPPSPRSFGAGRFQSGGSSVGPPPGPPWPPSTGFPGGPGGTPPHV